MKVKANRGFVGREGQVKRGTIIEVDQTRAQQLVKRGLVTAVQGTAGEGAKAGNARPSAKGRTGGRTGGAKQSSSSAPAQAPKAQD